MAPLQARIPRTREAGPAAYDPAMAGTAEEREVELEPGQADEIGRALAGLLAFPAREGATWWRAGIREALGGGPGPPARSVPPQTGAAPLRKSRGTERA